MRKITLNITLLMFSFFTGFILVEVTARIFVEIESPFALNPQNPSGEIRASVWDERGFWTLKPGYKGIFDNHIDFRAKTVTIEDDGGRQIPCATSSSHNPQMIFLLGDSQTFGWGLSNDETWANQLQCALNKQIPDTYRVKNFGFPGAQVDQIFKRGIEQVMPATRSGDVVIISITWNDLINFYAGRVFVRNAAASVGLRVNENTWDSIAPKNSIKKMMKTYRSRENLTLQLMRPLRYLNVPSWRYPFYQKYGLFLPSFVSPSAFLNSIKHISAAYRIMLSSVKMIYYRVRSEESLLRKFPKDTIANNFLVIKSLTSAFERQGVKVIVQLLPPRQFFDDFYYHSYSNNGQTFPTQDYLGYLANPWCKLMHLNCQNTYQYLKTSIPDKHSFTNDGHYNEAGALVIAKGLIEKFFPYHKNQL